jgi:hypothetical protein
MLVRDGASNEVVASRELRVDSMQCIAHSLHLIVGAAKIPKRTSKKKSVTAKPGSKRPRVASTDQLSNDESKDNEPDPEILDENDDDLAPSDSLVPEQTTAANSIRCRCHHQANVDVDHQAADVQAALEEDNPVLEEMRDAICTEIEMHTAKGLSEERLDALKKMQKVVQKFRTVGAYFPKSSKALDRMSMYLKQLGLDPDLMVLIDCPTRWNSSFVMAGRFISLYPSSQR